MLVSWLYIFMQIKLMSFTFKGQFFLWTHNLKVPTAPVIFINYSYVC